MIFAAVLMIWSLLHLSQTSVQSCLRLNLIKRKDMNKISKLNSDEGGVIHHLVLFVIIGFVVALTVFAGWRVWKNGQSSEASAEGESVTLSLSKMKGGINWGLASGNVTSQGIEFTNKAGGPMVANVCLSPPSVTAYVPVRTMWLKRDYSIVTSAVDGRDPNALYLSTSSSSKGSTGYLPTFSSTWTYSSRWKIQPYDGDTRIDAWRCINTVDNAARQLVKSQWIKKSAKYITEPVTFPTQVPYDNSGTYAYYVDGVYSAEEQIAK